MVGLEHAELRAAYKEQGQALPPRAHRATGHRCLSRKAAKEARREHSSGVSSSQKLHKQRGKASFKQGMAGRRMAHPVGGSFQVCGASRLQSTQICSAE